MTVSKNKARIPVQKRSIETRDRIMDAAWVLFAQKGYFKTSTHDLAERASVATGSFYAYFNNKKEVAIQLIRDFYQKASEKAFRNIQKDVGEDIEKNLDNGRKLVRSLIRSLKEAHDISPMIHSDAQALILLDKEVNRINGEEEKRVIEYIASLLQKYRRIIHVHDIDTAAAMLFLVSTEVIHRVVNNQAGAKEKRMLRELEDMICSYLFS